MPLFRSTAATLIRTAWPAVLLAISGCAVNRVPVVEPVAVVSVPAPAATTPATAPGVLPAGTPLAVVPQFGVPADRAAAQSSPLFVANQVVLQFRPDASEADRANVRQALGVTATQDLDRSGQLLLMATSLSVPDAVARLAQLPAVEFAEPNWIVKHDAVPNDPYYLSGLLWGMLGDGTTPSNQFGSQAAELWAQGFVGSSSVVVGIVDEGIDFNHPELAANVWTNPFDPVDGVDNDGNGRIDDVHGWDFDGNNNTVYDGVTDDHGTHVAGTIGAVGGNGVGVAGVNWNITMISAKFLNGNSGSGTTANAVLALEYLRDLKSRHNLNIIATNNSWGGGGYSTALHQAIIRGAKAGILFIAAAGNSSNDNDNTSAYPSGLTTTVAVGAESAASYDAVIAVAAVTSTGALASFSSYGATTVDIGAPGVGIYSTTPGNGYSSYNGTSMATPHVTGGVALYKSMNPGATAADIRAAILGQATATASLAGRTVTGGRLNSGGYTNMLPTLSVSDGTLAEGPSGVTSMPFTVSMSGTASNPVTVDYATTPGTAVAGSDYLTTTGTVTIAAGQTTGSFAVAIVGDTSLESTEIFTVTLANPAGAALNDSSGSGTIYDDDALGFTDPTLIAGSSIIKAVHITQLRNRIDGVRVARGLSGFSWTDASLTPAAAVIKAVHVAELRTALAEAYVAAGRTPPTYSDPVPTSGAVVRARQITQLREAVIAIE